VDWEYRKIALNDHSRRSDDIDLLSTLGEEGWELVTITPNNVGYLKRPIGNDVIEADGVQSSAVAPKYRDPATGDTWSGRGRMATWLKRKQDAGEDIEKYRV
jgi:DNA-binding protein H-NS